jgi:hypothetical protein
LPCGQQWAGRHLAAPADRSLVCFVFFSHGKFPLHDGGVRVRLHVFLSNGANSNTGFGIPIILSSTWGPYNICLNLGSNPNVSPFFRYLPPNSPLTVVLALADEQHINMSAKEQYDLAKCLGFEYPPEDVRTLSFVLPFFSYVALQILTT